MKILVINRQSSIDGGADRVFKNNFDLLKANGHDVIFFTINDHIEKNYKYNDYLPDKVNYREIKIKDYIISTINYLYNIKTKNNLQKIIKDFNPEIIHIHLFYGVLSSSILHALRISKAKKIHTVHDYRIICGHSSMYYNNRICTDCVSKTTLSPIINRCSHNSISQSFVLSLENIIKKYFIKIDNYIDKFIFVSDFAKNLHIKSGLVSNCKSVVKYNSSSFSFKKNTLKTDNKYYLYFGRISEEKGLRLLIHAFIKIPNIKLIIVGDGPILKELKDYSSEYTNIIFLGHKSGNELIEIIDNSYMTICPSIWYENNPLSIIESFARCKPVIGSNIGGIPELISTNNERGYLFKNNDVNDLIDNIINSYNISEMEYNNLIYRIEIFYKSSLDASEFYEYLLKQYNN